MAKKQDDEYNKLHYQGDFVWCPINQCWFHKIVFNHRMQKGNKKNEESRTESSEIHGVSGSGTSDESTDS